MFSFVPFGLCVSRYYRKKKISTGEFFFDTTSKTLSTQKILLFRCSEILDTKLSNVLDNVQEITRYYLMSKDILYVFKP